ncbi:MAG: polysaccharide deacetylase family protein [Ruminococcus sp.]|nr:polysaccharide deacetylase family protein [Candidatus Copronaster equi]
MKKFISILMIFIMIFSCSGCKNKNRSANAKTKAQIFNTYTGFEPLKEIHVTVDEKTNLPNIKIEHAYGVAKDSKPNEISVNSQNFFEEKNYKAITYDRKSKEKVLYLTFDCGYENGNTEKILDTLKEKKVPAAFFCTLDDIKSEPEIITRMIKEGHIVGNHSTTHPSFPEISRNKMAEEIITCDNYLRTKFGYTSSFFRFPKGEYSESALEVVENLGYTSVFWSLSYADWDTSVQKGKDYAYNKVTERLHPGAIILLHAVSSDNAKALPEIIDYARTNGYIFKSLNYLN